MYILVILITLILVSCNTEPTTDKSSPHFPPLFSQSEAASNSEQSKNLSLDRAKQTVVLNTDIAELQEGQHFRFQDFGGEQWVIEIVNRTVTQNGNITLSGTVASESGDFRMIATIGKSGTYGRIQTPTTTYQITVKNGKILLIDVYGPGNALVPKEQNDMAIPPGQNLDKRHQKDDVTTETASIIAQALPLVDGQTTIDLMIIYTPGMVTAYPGDLLQTRLDYLVAAANAAYANSEVNIHLRLVHSGLVNYSDQTSNVTALDSFTYGNAPFVGINALRQLHGADLVVLVRQFSYWDHNGCGLAWLLGSNGAFTGDGDFAYSVVSDGSEQVGNLTYYCSDLTLTHELGHNMGSAHDRENAGSYPPVFPYSHGYGISGRFGTVMSYIFPEVDKFSNPERTCGPENDPCGIDENAVDSAHNSLSLNNAMLSIAGFVPSQYPDDGEPDQFTLQDTINILKVLTNQAPVVPIDTSKDINGDGKIGMAEAIYSLQEAAGLR